MYSAVHYGRNTNALLPTINHASYLCPKLPVTVIVLHHYIIMVLSTKTVQANISKIRKAHQVLRECIMLQASSDNVHLLLISTVNKYCNVVTQRHKKHSNFSDAIRDYTAQNAQVLRSTKKLGIDGYG